MNAPLGFNVPEINILEWGPIGLLDPVSKTWSFPPMDDLYLGGDPASLPRDTNNDEPDATDQLGDEYDRAIEADGRPFVYLPVNRDQAKRVNAYYQRLLRDDSLSSEKRLEAAFAKVWDSDDERLSKLSAAAL
jgi:hypothetical protein